MFNTLRQDSVLYVLDKRGVPSLSIGRVTAVSNPAPKYSTTFNPAAGFETTVDISVALDSGTADFKKVPSNLSIYGENGIVISESREAMLSEVDTIQGASRKALEMTEYHNKVIPACEEIKSQLDPSIAKDREQEKKITALEGQVSTMNTALADIQKMLKKLVN